MEKPERRPGNHPMAQWTYFDEQRYQKRLAEYNAYVEREHNDNRFRRLNERIKYLESQIKEK